MTTAIRRIRSLFPPKRSDFSLFVAQSSKQDKQRALKKAADRAIREQQKVLHSTRSLH